MTRRRRGRLRALTAGDRAVRLAHWQRTNRRMRLWEKAHIVGGVAEAKFVDRYVGTRV